MTVLPFPVEAAQADVTDTMDWREFAPCRSDPETFFDDDPAAKALARRVCADCPVRALCLADAVELSARGERVWGVWGGLDERQRRLLTPAQRRAVIAEASQVLAEAA